MSKRWLSPDAALVILVAVGVVLVWLAGTLTVAP